MFRRFLNDTTGQFAIMFAGFATVLILGAGTAVDVIGIQKSKSDLQALTDAAVLAAASSKSDNVAELMKLAQAAIDANVADSKGIKIQLNVVDDIIKVSGSTNYDTQLMGILGMKTLPVTALSEAPIPKDIPLNIALVLDRTGSMSGDNMASLKSASAKLIEVFDSYDGEVRAAVVPFSHYVNVGMGNRYANWMEVPEDSSTTSATETCVTKKDLTKPEVCTTETAVTTKDGIDVEYDYQSCPETAYGPEYEHCYFPTSSETWRGCAGSREGTLNKNPAYLNKPIPGIMNVSCGEEVLPLTINITEVKDRIDSLTASGPTYIPSGLIWGWRMVDSKAPFDDLTNNQDDRKRAIVLMTDGANTRSINQPLHNAKDNNAADDLTAELCDLIKKRGIDIFTVAYKLSDSGDNKDTKDVIRVCASSEAYFFDAANTAELELAFEDIGRSLYEVRLSR